MEFGLEIVIVLILVVLNGLLAMSEFAVVSAQKVRLQERAEGGSAGASAALDLAATPDRFLATVQFGISLIGILAGAVGGAALSGDVAVMLDDLPVIAPYNESVAFVLVVGATTYLSLVIGELVPKRLALQRPEAIATLMARPLTTLSWIGRPVIAVLSVSTRAVLRVLGQSETPESRVTEAEIRMLIEQGAQSGALEATEEEMALGVLDLGELHAHDLMTPRRRVMSLDIDADERTNRETIAESGYSYYPVYSGTPDNVRGFLGVKDLWSEGRFDIDAVLTPPLFVPESAPAFNVMELFKQTGAHRALVVDEYGAVQGLITLHDLMEAIVGELDILVEAEQPIIERADGSWLIDGMVSIHELRDVLGVELASESDPGQYQTLGGFIMAELGRVPSPSDSFEWDGLQFEVVDMDRTRVDKVLVTPPRHVEPADRDAGDDEKSG